MSKCRFLRCLVCALVICSLIFNYAAIPAKAVVGTIALGTVTGAAAAGVAATLFAVAMGIVAVGLTAQLVIDIGKDLRQSGIDFYQNDTEKQTQWITWIDGLEYDLGGGGDGTGSSGGDPHNDPFLNLAGNALVYDVLQNWGAKLMQGEGIETEGDEVAESGMLYYGDMQFPEVPSIDTAIWPNLAIIYSSYYKAYIFIGSCTSMMFNASTQEYYTGSYDIRCCYTTYLLSGNRWTINSTGSHSKHINSGLGSITKVVWTNTGVTDNSGNVVVNPSQPSDKNTVVLNPYYIGDIPQKIQNGEADEDDIVIPDIDYSKIFEGQTDAVTALDRVSTQLADGTMTYDQYLEMTTPQTGTGTGSGSGTSTDVWNPPESPVGFALDLSNYFPFCIPFDLYDFFSCLNADPVAPVIQWELPLPGGSTYPIEIDLSPFDSVAQLLRRLQLLLFIVGLAVKTRDLIKG